MQCDGIQRALHFYIDRELTPTEELEVEAHLMSCAACRRSYEDLRQVVDTVRGSKPLYESSPAFRDQMEQTIRRAGNRAESRWTLGTGVRAAVAAAFALVVLSLVLFSTGTSFNAYAADTHLRYATGKLPLDIRSSEPAEVSGWLQTRLPFHLTVPNYPSDTREPKAYTLSGARLMQYGGEDVAYLAYTMHGRPVSLLVASSAKIVPGGQDLYRSGNLQFHFSSQKGLKTITWRDRDLVYALVSDVQVDNAQSCVVCHGSAAERSRFENMSPE